MRSSEEFPKLNFCSLLSHIGPRAQTILVEGGHQDHEISFFFPHVLEHRRRFWNFFFYILVPAGKPLGWLCKKIAQFKFLLFYISFKLKIVTTFDVRATSDNGRRPIAKGHFSCASRKISCYMASNNKINQLIGYL